MVNRTVDVRVEERLGAGAFGAVFKAQILSGVHKDTACAAKELKKPGYDDFLQELLPLSLLWSKPHPHIVSFYGYGRRREQQATTTEQGCAHLLLMEWVPGRSLREELNVRVTNNLHFDDDRALEIIRQLLEALDHLHNSLCVLHRDVKPDNILLNSHGDVKLGDFGVATLGRRSRERDVGSVRYMAPEVAQRGVEYDGRADVYSAGCTLVEMLALKLELRLRVVEEGSLVPEAPPNLTIMYWKAKGGGRCRVEVQVPLVRSAAVKTLMTDMIDDDPARRPDTHALLSTYDAMARHPQPCTLRSISSLSIATTTTTHSTAARVPSPPASPPPSPPVATATAPSQRTIHSWAPRACVSRTMLFLAFLVAQILLLSLAFYLGATQQQQEERGAPVPEARAQAPVATATPDRIWRDSDQDLIPDCAEEFIADAGEALVDATEAVLESSGLPLIVWSSIRDGRSKRASAADQKLQADLLDALAAIAFSAPTWAALGSPLVAALRSALASSPRPDADDTHQFRVD